MNYVYLKCFLTRSLIQSGYIYWAQTIIEAPIVQFWISWKMCSPQTTLEQSLFLQNWEVYILRTKLLVLPKLWENWGILVSEKLYRWHLNNLSLNCVSPLICRFFSSVNILEKFLEIYDNLKKLTYTTDILDIPHNLEVSEKKKSLCMSWMHKIDEIIRLFYYLL